MKRVFRMVCSVCLILACLFSLFACVKGMQDILSIQDYKNADADRARAGIATARDGIAQLRENEETYLNGVSTYEAGLIDYSKGQVTLAAGSKQLQEGYAAYAQAKAKLDSGKQLYAENKALIEANTASYEAGKAMLAQIEPLLPYVDQYVAFRDGTIAKLPGFSGAQSWFMTVVRPIAAQQGLEIPADVTDFPAYIQNMVANGRAQIATYESGVAQLAEAEQTIASGEQQLQEAGAALAAAEAELAAGKQNLAAGAATLASGEEKLSVYEGGQAQLVAGMELLLDEMTPCAKRSGTITVPGLQERLGEQFSIWVLNDDGSVKIEHDAQFVDLESCSRLCDVAETYLAEQEADIKGELYPRIAICTMMGLAGILGIVAGILGLTGGRRSGFVCGVITAALAVAANITGLVTGYTNYAYPVRNDAHEYLYSGDLQLYAVIVLAVVAILFAVAAALARRAAHPSEAPVTASIL